LGRGGNPAAAGRPHALASAVEGQAVIAAFDVVVLDPPLRQGQLAVGTCILQRDYFAVAVAENANLLAENQYLAETVADLVAPGRDVPGILEKHTLTFP